ncbi:MAG: hypothetical protein IJX61_05195 [Ruminococcus sp.]|nr:hypothetical protein [Ruminococcus sp.]
MTLQIIDLPLISAESLSAGNVPVWLIILISAIAFIAAGIISGFVSYKIKLRSLKADQEKSDNENPSLNDR